MIVQVEESDPAWVVAARLVTEGVTESPPETIFTKTELKQSRWLRLNATWHEGFPQPEEDYQRQTYDLSDFCAVCGTGYEQRAPFQFASEPNWGRRHILQFNWVFDEFFVPPETFRGVFQPLGIESRPVVHHKTGHELKSVVQLRVKTGLLMTLINRGGNGESAPLWTQKAHGIHGRAISPRRTTPGYTLRLDSRVFW